ncbi:hypothetical protein KSP39_PZI007565 [Platanthera zijinensis]|uniref:Uncharacterized protein n=1 Tax=Platanthera zijinensis TaxID=2320716 RepID=A0AAP0G938_9ASPA
MLRRLQSIISFTINTAIDRCSSHQFKPQQHSGLCRIRNKLLFPLSFVHFSSDFLSPHTFFRIFFFFPVEEIDIASLLTIQPWVSRLSQVHFTSTRSPQKIHASTDQDRNCSPDMIISPSPLVSWRAGGGGGFVTGRPLFLVTPLSKPSERILSLCPESSKLGVRNFSMKETNEEALQLSPSVIVSRNGGNLPEIVKKSNMSETRIKMSVSIEPPPLFNFSEAYSGMGGASDDTSSLSLHHNSTIGRRDSGEGLEWFLSPPKTCALMDPDDGSKIAEDKSSSSSIPTISISASMDSPSPQELHDFAGKRYDEALEWFLSPPKTCALMEPLEGKAQSTPVPSESALKNPRPGENTLKKELWTKFQAVSMGRMSYTDSVPQEAPKKDFLDLLEELKELTPQIPQDLSVSSKTYNSDISALQLSDQQITYLRPKALQIRLGGQPYLRSTKDPTLSDQLITYLRSKLDPTAKIQT